MKFFRPRIKSLKFKTKRQVATSVGLAALLTLIVGIVGITNFNSNAANFTSPNWNESKNTWDMSGTWHNCDGSVDNDAAHHSLDMNDTDSAHHMGMVCQGNQEAWSPSNTTPYSREKVKAAFSEESAPVKIDSNQNSQIAAVQPEVNIPAPKIMQKSESGSNNSANPFAGAKLYVNSNNDPANYVRNNSGSYNAQLMSKIANQPEVTWLGGWNWNLSADVSNAMKNAQAQGSLPVFVVYNVPNRDCGGYSSGGVSDAASYRNWVNQIANTIGSQKAVVILEPDGVTLMDCLSSWQKTERFQMIRDAVSSFKSKGNTAVYIDAGHPNWLSADDIAGRLKQSGIGQADGFALNIANFYTNDQNASYGKQISELTGGKHFIVDTGRNGSGPAWDNQWCNPSGRSLGTPPTTSTGNSLIDAYLWVKGPGGSDGNCNGGPSAGQFWPDYALGLAQRTNW